MRSAMLVKHEGRLWWPASNEEDKMDSYKVVVELKDGKRDVTYHSAFDSKHAIEKAKRARGFFAPVLFVDVAINCRYTRVLTVAEGV